MKEYSIILDYEKNNKYDFTSFIVKVNAEYINNKHMRLDKTLFNFNFKLKDENTGFAIFKEIREYFVKKNDLQYPSFQIDESGKYVNYQIKTNHHVTLCSMIHSKNDINKLEKLNNRIFEKYKAYIRKIHTVNSLKDEIQISKAEKKRELALVVIDMLNELTEVSDINDKSYQILIDNAEIKDFYEFRIQLLKNNKSIPLNIAFKLRNKRIGVEILNEIVNYYAKNYNIMFDSYDYKTLNNSNIDYVIIGNNNISINYRIPKEYFDESITKFNNTIQSKRLKKTK